MKRNLIISWLLSALCISAMGQTSQLDYSPFALDGKVWDAQVGGIKENVYFYEIDGDTMINGESWKKVYNYVFPKIRFYSYYAAVRDVGNKVYAIAKGSNRPRLLYDFDMKAGNIVQCGIEGNAFLCLLDKNEPSDSLLGFPYETFLRVERIDTIEARGLQHRRYTLTLLDAYRQPFGDEEDPIIGSVVWVEGVGSGAGPFSPWMPLPPYYSILLYCIVNHSCIFGFTDFYEAEAVNHVGRIQDIKSEKLHSYDLSGRRVSHLPRGVYIKDGRKVVVK